MTLTRNDFTATVLTALAVLAFAATHQSWDVWLVGSSHRWAAGAIMLLGMVTCGLGQAGKERGKDTATRTLAVVGALALAFGIWAIWTASLTALWFLIVAVVVLWAGATLRHAAHPTHGRLVTG
jgi:hypothetical protein